MELLIGPIAFAALVITEIGHGLWVLFASFLKAVFNPASTALKRERSGRRSYRFCPACPITTKPVRNRTR